MPTSRLELALAAFKAALATLSPAVNVERNTTDAVADTATKATLIMVDGGHSTNTIDGSSRTTYRQRVAVFGFVGAVSDEAAGSAVTDLHAKTVQAVLANRSLGGTCEWVEEADMTNPEFETMQGARSGANFEMGFEIEVDTKPGDPFSAPA